MNYFNTFKTKTAQEVSFEIVFGIIRGDELLKQYTMTHRDLLNKGDAEAAKQVKEMTPQVAVGFRMEGGRAKENCRECLNHVLIDFDAKKPGERLPQQELERVKTILRTSVHTRLGYESISGLGYHIVVPFLLPEGITIDLAADRKRGEELYKRAHLYINKVYSVWCGHPMDPDCGNINRMTGLSHDPQAVYRSDAYPFRLTREDLGIDAEGKLVGLKTPKHAVDASGNRVSVPLGNCLERAVRMVEEAGTVFAKGSRHNFVVRVSFILNRLGVDEEEAAQALDDAYKGLMEDRPSQILHSCYKTAADEFGAWMPRRSKMEIKAEMISSFLKEKDLRYDILTQKTQVRQENGQWTEMKEREENDLFLECCRKNKEDFSVKLFQTVLNSNVVPETHPLREYVNALPAWTPDMPDYIDQAARQVHMASEAEDLLWRSCFKKWFTAMLAGWMKDETVNHQVIVFVGKQGIYKSTWLNHLMPPQLAAYATDNIDIERLDKDEKLRAAEYGLVNIDELDKLTDRQLNTIKAMITNTKVDVRASYGRHKEKRTRVASYVASGNKEEFLTDQTGNRRWLPFHVVAIDSPYTHTLPYEGMYAQALYLLNDKDFNYWFDLADIQALEGHVEEFMVPTSEEQLVLIHFSPIEPTEPRAAFWTVAEIAAKITREGSLKKAVDQRQLGGIMKKQGFKPGRQGHRGLRGYYVLEHTQNDMDRLHDPKVW